MRASTAFFFSCLLACSGGSSSDGTIVPPGDSTPPPSAGTPPGATTPPPGTNPAPPPPASFGPDICGNGKDDDGNGIVDDGCSAPACTLGVIRQFDLPVHLEGTVLFDHPRSVITVFGNTTSEPGAIWEYGEDGTVRPEKIALYNGSSSSWLAKTPDGYVAWWMAEPSAPSTRQIYVLDSSLAKSGAPLPLPEAVSSIVGSAGKVWTGVQLDQSLSDHDWEDYDVRSFDSKTMTQLSAKTVSFDKAVDGTSEVGVWTYVYDFGGVPAFIRWGRAWSYDTGELHQVSIARLDGSTWKVGGITDGAPGEMFYSTFTLAARSGSQILTCMGGGRGPANSAKPMQDYHFDCHAVEAASGGRSGDFALEYTRADDFDYVSLDWGAADDFIVARTLWSAASNPPSSTVRLDRLSSTGKLTQGVLDVTVPAFGAGHAEFHTIAPNLHVLVTPKGENAYVTIVGCH
jgi:hypothetical protein